MSFGKAFAERRRVRGISMREFDISASYIHGVEKRAVLPSQDQLDSLLGTIGAVAVEQGCESDVVDDEAKQLRMEWWGSQLERHGASSEAASALAKLLVLDEAAQAGVIEIINRDF